MFKVPEIRSIQDVIRYNLCISCGACVIAAPPGAIEMVYSSIFGMFIPQISNSSQVDGTGVEFEVCPGKGLDLIRLSNKNCKNSGVHDLKLGFINYYASAKTTNIGFLENASSGGIVTAIADYLLRSGKVKGIAATKFIYGPNGPQPQTVILQSNEELIQCQGSKYIPVPAIQVLQTLETFEGEIAFIGTPCQIAGIRMLQERFEIYRQKIKYIIGSFCGGVKNFYDLNGLIHRQGIKPKNVVRFRYRGGGQPGSMLIEENTGKIKERDYPGYTGDTGYRKLERCRLCIDGTAELADFSCGDAWLKKFLQTGEPWSIVITRNEESSTIIQEMINQSLITVSEITLDEIKKSQYSNLESKKVRQLSRRKLYGLLRKPVPAYDGGFLEESTNLYLEFNVYFRYLLYNFLEKSGLYSPMIRSLRLIRKTLKRNSRI